jgi:hypothetical protein
LYYAEYQQSHLHGVTLVPFFSPFYAVLRISLSFGPATLVWNLDAEAGSKQVDLRHAAVAKNHFQHVPRQHNRRFLLQRLKLVDNPMGNRRGNNVALEREDAPEYGN